MPAQCFLKRHLKVEHVGRAMVLAEDLAKHVAGVLRHENALDDDVVADAGAVADGVSDEADVLPVRYIVLTQDHSPEMVLLGVRCAWPQCALERRRQGALARGRVATQHDQVRSVLHKADASGRHVLISA
jgi:hypothetical protein